MSPLLFNLVVDVLTKMLIKASARSLVKWLGQSIYPGGVISLQYIDDTIMFVDSDPTLAKNLRWVLTCFEQVSGMRINFDKSEMIPINLVDDEIHSLSDIFGCPVGSFPIRYLGILLHHDKLSREDIQPLVDKILKRIAGWKGRLLSYAARITLIKACLASIPIYILYLNSLNGLWT